MHGWNNNMEDYLKIKCRLLAICSRSSVNLLAKLLEETLGGGPWGPNEPLVTVFPPRGFSEFTFLDTGSISCYRSTPSGGGPRPNASKQSMPS